MAAYDVTALDSAVTVSPLNGGVSSTLVSGVVKVDDTHVVAAFTNDDTFSGEGGIRAFEVDETTGEITALDSELNFSGGGDGVSQISMAILDATHIIVFWHEVSTADTFAQVFTVNLSTWAITAEDSPTLWSSGATGLGITQPPVIVDSRHVVLGFSMGTPTAYVRAFGVDNTTFAVTALDTELSLAASGGSISLSMVDSDHAIAFYSGASGDGFAVALAINTSTWAITTAGSAFEFDTADGSNNSCFQIDTTHYINFWRGVAGDGFVQAFTLNTSTWAITANGSALEFDTGNAQDNSCSIVVGSYFINFWRGTDVDGFTRAFSVNTGTYAVTAVGTAALEYDTTESLGNKTVQILEDRFVTIWRQGSSVLMQAFEVEIPAVPYTPRIITLGI